jgi:uncharacterized protein with PIN domain
MGTPSRLDIFSKYVTKVAANELTAALWVDIIGKVIAKIDCELKYLFDEVFLGGGLSCWGNNNHVRNINNHVINWCSRDLNQYTKVFRLAQVETNITTPNQVSDASEYKKTEYQLFLTRSGKLVVIKTRFLCLSTPRDSRPNFESEQALSCRIYQPSSDQLTQLFESDRTPGLLILKRLQELFEQTIKVREERLGRQKEQLIWLTGIMDKIVE